MANVDFNELMNMISKMDKKDLAEKMSQVSKMLETKSPEQILRDMNQNSNSKNK